METMVLWRDKRIKFAFECKICTEQFNNIHALYRHAKFKHKGM
jgi:hypothetical protein